MQQQPMMKVAYKCDMRLFKAAAALNETGVSLLVRGSNQEAMKTFTDALSLMRAASSQHRACSGVSQIPSESDIYGRLHKAAARLFLPKADLQQPEQGARVQVIILFCDVLCPDAVQVIVHELSPCSMSGVAIRIDASDEFEANVDLETAIILFNLATACRCEASSLKSKRKARRFIEKAVQCSQAVNDILSRPSTIAIDEIELGRMQLLTMLNLQSLIGLCAQTQQSQERFKHYEALCCLRGDFLESESIIFPPKMLSARAAPVA